jgi:hypothetical protein
MMREVFIVPLRRGPGRRPFRGRKGRDARPGITSPPVARLTTTDEMTW